jgi:hypothetical protein
MNDAARIKIDKWLPGSDLKGRTTKREGRMIRGLKGL